VVVATEHVYAQVAKSKPASLTAPLAKPPPPPGEVLVAASRQAKVEAAAAASAARRTSVDYAEPADAILAADGAGAVPKEPTCVMGGGSPFADDWGGGPAGSPLAGRGCA
jgi:hypothetical protein